MTIRLKNIKHQLSRYTPLGFDADKLNPLFFIFTLSFAFIIFLVSYHSDWSNAHRYPAQSEAFMQSYLHYIRWFFYLLALCLLRLVYLAVRFYRYHLGDGNSIYVMKRLPDPEEFQRRCLWLPLILAVAETAGYIIVLVICFIIYTVGGTLI